MVLLQEIVAVPPPLEVATERSYEGDVRIKLPPVELERVTTTLVAFTPRASATEPDVMVRVVEGLVRIMAVLDAKLRGAA
jgi:hypothetical protein